MSLKVTKTISISWAIILLLFAPKRLVTHSVDHAIRSQPSDPSGDRERDLRRGFEKQFNNAIYLMRSTLFSSFAIVAGAITAALLSAAMLKTASIPKSTAWNASLQYGGIGVLLWATLAKVGSAIRTWDGATLPERVDIWIYRVLYIIGSYSLALSVVW